MSSSITLFDQDQSASAGTAVPHPAQNSEDADVRAQREEGTHPNRKRKASIAGEQHHDLHANLKRGRKNLDTSPEDDHRSDTFRAFSAPSLLVETDGLGVADNHLDLEMGIVTLEVQDTKPSPSTNTILHLATQITHQIARKILRNAVKVDRSSTSSKTKPPRQIGHATLVVDGVYQSRRRSTSSRQTV